jgi:hypothetical protein
VYCPGCGSQNDAGAGRCASCGEALPRVPRPEDSRGDRLPLTLRLRTLIVPPNASRWAIAAGYAGLFAIPCAFLWAPGPIAIVLGIVGLRDLKRNPDRRGRGRAWFGLVTGVLVTSFLIAAFIALSNRMGGWAFPW